MKPLTMPHLHLLLNHVPTIGAIVGVALLLLSIIRRTDPLRRASFEVLFLVALASFPTYLTGVAAEVTVAGQAEFSPAAMRAHHDAALPAFVLMQVTGALAWIGLWQFRRASRPARWVQPWIVVFSTATLITMAQAAAIGGGIRHPEIAPAIGAAALSAGPGGATAGWFTPERIEAFVSESAWAWPAAETLHFIGLCLVIGVLLTLNLRILGVMKSLSFAALHRFLPWGVLGFALNLMTGMMFIVVAGDQYVDNVAFYLKVVLLVLAGIHLLYLTVSDATWVLRPGDDAGLREKVAAVAALAAWAGVLYGGRMLPFLGDAI